MNLKLFVRNAMLAAVYAALTIFLAPLSYSLLQVRVAEAMMLIGFYNKNYIPGLTIGVIIANLNSPLGIVDIGIGTLASLLALIAMRYCKTLFLASLMPVLFNGVLVGAELYFLGLVPQGISLVMAMLYVAGGEFIAVSILGIAIMRAGLAKLIETRFKC